MSIPITEFRNAQSISSDNSRIDVEINHRVYGWIPYTLDIADQDMTINNDDLLALIGTNFVAYTPPTQAELDAEAASEVRALRDFKLQSEVDPIVSNALRWADLTQKNKTSGRSIEQIY